MPEVSKLSEACVFECCGVELYKYDVILVCLYRTPSSNIQTFFHKLDTLLLNLCRFTRKKLILCGDINIDLLKICKEVTEYKHILESYNLESYITTATRITDSMDTCIDHITSNIENGIGAVHDLGLSDHTAQTFSWVVQQRRTAPLKWWYELRRDVCSENRNKFLNCISSLTFELSENRANVAFKIFYDLYCLFYNLCFPIIRVRIINRDICKSKWLTKGLRISCKTKRNLYNKYKFRRNNDTKTEYKKYCYLLRQCFTFSRKANNAKYIHKADNKCKAAWRAF